MEDIRNEVDRLIEHLRAEPIRPYRLSKLAAEANLSVPQARKWIHILEARGQVRVRYSLTDDEVMWVAKTIPHAGRSSSSSSETSFESNQDTAIEKPPQNAQMEAANFNEEQFRRIRGQTNTINPQNSPETPISNRPPRPPADAERAAVRGESTATTNELDQAVEESNFKRTLAAAAAAAEPDILSPKQTSRSKPVEVNAEPALPPLPPVDERTAKMSQKLKLQIEKARAKMGDIDKIKEEKRRLLVEVYRPMETKLEGEAGTITEKLINLENQILSLREEAARVPGEFSEIASEQERIAYVASEMLRAYNETNAQMTQSMAALHQARANAQTRLEEAQADLEAQKAAADKTQNSTQVLAEMEAAAHTRLNEAAEALAAQQAQLDAARADLSQLESIKTGLAERMRSADATLEQHKSLLSDIEKQLGQLDHVEEWVSKHQAEYDSRMQQLAHYIEDAEREHAKLKAAVDSGFVHSYLKDLRALSESYEFELSQAQQIEGDIDTRLGAAKAELAALLAQAREIADLQEMHLSQREDEQKDLTETAMSRGKLYERVHEQGAEREDLRNMIRRTVAGKSIEEKKTTSTRAPLPPIPSASRADSKSPALEPETDAESVSMDQMFGQNDKPRPASRGRSKKEKALGRKRKK